MIAGRVAVVIPCLNEERHIAGVLAAFEGCRSDYVIFVVDGGSSDRTREIVARSAAEDARIRLVANPRRIQSAGVNAACRMFDDDIDVFVRADAHCIYPPGYVGTLIDAMEMHGADSVVVPMRTVARGPFQRALSALQNSRMGNGGALHRRRTVSGFVDHGHHAAFRVEAFRAVGGYDGTFSHNEDAELDIRLVDAGRKIWLEAGAEIGYLPRESLGALARQYFAYGNGRARTFLKHGQSMELRQLAPLAILGTCLAGLTLSCIHPSFLLVPAVYAMACVSGGVLLAIRERDPAVVAAGPAAMVMHLSWALGFAMKTLRSVLGFGSKNGSESGTVFGDVDSVCGDLEAVRKERDELQRQVEVSRARASALMGNDTFGEPRDPLDERSLVEEEDRVRSGLMRLTVLDDNIARLEESGPSIDPNGMSY